MSLASPIPVDRLCQLAQVSRAGFYRWRHAPPASDRDIDLRDGVEDGKITPNVQDCQACGRTMAPRHKRCMYCGSERLVESPFHGI